MQAGTAAPAARERTPKRRTGAAPAAARRKRRQPAPARRAPPRSRRKEQASRVAARRGPHLRQPAGAAHGRAAGLDLARSEAPVRRAASSRRISSALAQPARRRRIRRRPRPPKPRDAAGASAAPAPVRIRERAGTGARRQPALYGEPAYRDAPGHRAAARPKSKQTVPHFYLTVDCEIDALLKSRAALNAESQTPTGFRSTTS